MADYDPNADDPSVPHSIPSLPPQDMTHGANVPPVRPSVQTTPGREADAATGAAVQRVMDAEQK